MKAASCAAGSSVGGSTRMMVPTIAGSNASAATVRSTPWNRGRDDRVSQVAVVGGVPVLYAPRSDVGSLRSGVFVAFGARIVTGPECLAGAS
jgi:hypothetical protein